MHISQPIQIMSYLDPAFCTIFLVTLVRSKAVRSYLFLAALLVVRGTADVLCLLLMELAYHGLDRHLAYKAYFYMYWLSYAVEAVLCLLVILSIFRLAMAPLKGLQSLGMLVFRWAGAISIAIAAGIGLAPHQSGTDFLVAMITQLQQTSSILILCLLLFVCFAIRPMGLSYRSRIFGVSVGLGIMSASSLIASAWIREAPRMDSIVNLFLGVAGCGTLLLWSAYFAFPEEKRRMILLPTTSPFLKWNQISEVLGDAPGFVAIAGIPPEVFAPAELEVIRRASLKMMDPRDVSLPIPSAVEMKALTA